MKVAGIKASDLLKHGPRIWQEVTKILFLFDQIHISPFCLLIDVPNSVPIQVNN